MLFVRAAQGLQSLPYSGSSTPSSRPFSIAWLRLSGKGTMRERERESRRAVIVFQFNQLHCDRPVSIGGMMLQPPSSILTLTPFEMWAVSNGRIDAVKMLPTRLETVKLKGLFTERLVQEQYYSYNYYHGR